MFLLLCAPGLINRLRIDFSTEFDGFLVIRFCTADSHGGEGAGGGSYSFRVVVYPKTGEKQRNETMPYCARYRLEGTCRIVYKKEQQSKKNRQQFGGRVHCAQYVCTIYSFVSKCFKTLFEVVDNTI